VPHPSCPVLQGHCLFRSLDLSSERSIAGFFSSRRRHTISDRDWSSDVCSSDLWWESPAALLCFPPVKPFAPSAVLTSYFSARKRSEERRVGKECRAWRSCEPYRKDPWVLPLIRHNFDQLSSRDLLIHWRSSLVR